MPEPARRARGRIAWRPLLRSLHRDAGYLAVGMTLVYAVSGIAVNHIPAWDPSFASYRSTHQLTGALPAETPAAASAVLRELGIHEAPREVYRAAPDQLDILLKDRTLHVNPSTGRVLDEGHQPRFFLRAANWLHLNRGKRAWTIAADVYAGGLLFLACSGLFMIPGRKGLIGRGGILAMIGAAVPMLYVLLSGPR